MCGCGVNCCNCRRNCCRFYTVLRRAVIPRGSSPLICLQHLLAERSRGIHHLPCPLIGKRDHPFVCSQNIAGATDDDNRANIIKSALKGHHRGPNGILNDDDVGIVKVETRCDGT